MMPGGGTSPGSGPWRPYPHPPESPQATQADRAAGAVLFPAHMAQPTPDNQKWEDICPYRMTIILRVFSRPGAAMRQK